MNSSIINKQSNKLQCSLHSLPFSLYCDRCLQLVCQKCTFIGPHHTTIHSLIGIPQAYERRVQQLNTRLSTLSQSREHCLSKITQVISQIEQERLHTKQIQTQNQQHKTKIQRTLQNAYENIISTITADEELILEQLNQINDLGHEFETISMASDIDCIVNYDRIIDQFRQVVDRLQILLDKNVEFSIKQLPKQLSDMRIKLSQIESYQQLFKKKVQVLQQLIKKLSEQIKKIKKPKIDYESRLAQINTLLERFEPSSGEFSLNLQRPNKRKAHFVCHFCGIIMDDMTINSVCGKNKVHQEGNSSKYYSYTNKQTVDFGGYCCSVPEIAKFGTSRHYFGQPKNPNLFFRAAFLCMMLGRQVLNLLLTFLPEQDSQLQIVNQSSLSQNNSFTNYLELLLLKVATLARIKDKNVQELFQKEDIKNGKGDKIGCCQIVPMQYIFMEILGLKENQTCILLDVCKIPVAEPQEFKDRKLGDIRNYRHLVDKVKVINI